MKHKALLFAAVIGILLLCGVGGIIFIHMRQETGTTAYIYQDGECIQTIDLSSVTEPYTIDITGVHGAVNKLEIRPGEIAVIEASCPDKVCVNMGFIKNKMLPITCLPNKLVIRIEDNHFHDNTAIDGAAY